MANSKKPTGRPKKNAAPVTLAQIVQPLPASPPRRLRMPQYKSLKYKHRIKHPVRLPSGWNILKRALRVLWKHRWVFLGIISIYGLLNVVLVQGFGSSSQVQALKDSFSSFLVDGFGQLVSGVAVFGFLVASSGNSARDSGAYQTLLIIIISLVLIWTLRQVNGTTRVRVKDAFYEGLAPLVPFVLVVLVIALQFVPFYLGSQLYGIAINNGIAVFLLEKVLWGLLLFLTALLSMYMVSSSLFALYIVTLPRMTPLKALRSARQLVRYRRWTVMRKILYMFGAVLLMALIVMLPIIIFITPVAPWAFFVVSMVAIAVIHAYMYTLYRDLLVETVKIEED